MANPKVKVGDKLLVIASKNSTSTMNGTIVTVTRSRQSGSNSIQVIGIDGQQRNLFYNGPADVFVIADKEAILKHYKEQESDLKDQLKNIEDKIKFTEKYDSEEEFVADKLDQLIQVHAGTKSERIKQMAEILKELKTSNIL